MDVFGPSTIFEHFGRAGKSMLANFNFSLLFIFTLFILTSDELFNITFDLVENSSVVLLVNRGVFLDLKDLAVTVVNKTGVFGSLPVFSESLYDSQYKAFLFIGEATVLTH
jgi:hypothetical protein